VARHPSNTTHRPASVQALSPRRLSLRLLRRLVSELLTIRRLRVYNAAPLCFLWEGVMLKFNVGDHVERIGSLVPPYMRSGVIIRVIPDKRD
jgi:hypothetical protein